MEDVAVGEGGEDFLAAMVGGEVLEACDARPRLEEPNFDPQAHFWSKEWRAASHRRQVT